VAEQLGDFADTGKRDLTVVTTLDPRMQAEAEATMAEIIAREGSRMAVRQGALVAMSPDGAVRAMVGGRDYNESQFNRATQAQRQPGSAFKPFVYLAGLEAGLRPFDQFVDAPIRVGSWQPRDNIGRYQGEMTLAEGLAQSVNTIAVQVAQRAGIRNVVAVAHRLGISSELAPEMSLSLGTNEVNLLELVSRMPPSPMAAMGHGRTASPRSATAPERSCSAAQAQGSQVVNPLCRHDERDVERCHWPRHWQERRTPTPGRRQDRHHAGLPRRMVHRVHRRPRCRGLARQRR
jgi:membrane carboxypeptidase/penicillin-binding protein PbpC